MRFIIGLVLAFVFGGCSCTDGIEGVDLLPENECGESADCATGEYCKRLAIGSHCEPLRVQGEECSSQSACTAGLVCNQGYEPARCEPPGDEGSPCLLDTDCAGELPCNAGHAPARCEPPGEVGSVCAASKHCAGAGLCNRPDIEEAGSCIEPGSLQAGEACTFLVSGICAEGLVCNLEQRCAPPAREGEPCAIALDGPTGCEDGLVCWEEVCRPPGQAGDPCPCEEGLICHGAWDPPRCEPPSEEGMPCSSEADCAEGALCLDEICGYPED